MLDRVKLPSFAPRHFALVAMLGLVSLGATGCVSKPTMRLNHAEVAGVQLATFPPSLGVVMTVVLDVHNPNSYDVAIRAVSGTVYMANKYPVIVNYQAPGDGLWLPSDTTTPVRVPITMPVELAVAVLREAFSSPVIPYRFVGRANVTGTRTFKIEKDDYSVDEQGTVTRQQIESILPATLFGPR